MSLAIAKPAKIGTEITVRISITFQEAPDVHTLLAMTPVRERGKLVRSALERYIAETAHPAGDVEQQISAISTWLRSRATVDAVPVSFVPPLAATPTARGARELSPNSHSPVAVIAPDSLSPDDRTKEPVSPSINRWLET